MTFQELNLSKPILRAVAQAGYQKPSPIQAGAIPPVLQGQDLMGCDRNMCVIWKKGYGKRIREAIHKAAAGKNQ